MSNNLHLLSQLKNKLTNETDFNEIMKFFFDNFAENPGFMRLGKMQTSKLLEAVVSQAASSALKEPVSVSHLRVTRLPEQRFCHGPCFINGRMATLFYFEDIRTGLLAIVKPRGEMLYTRITAVAVVKEDESAKWN